jgi:hypothetical protein
MPLTVKGDRMLRALICLIVLLASPFPAMPQGSSVLPDTYLRSMYCLTIVNDWLDSRGMSSLIRAGKERAYCEDYFGSLSGDRVKEVCELAKSHAVDMEERQKRLRDYIAVQTAAGVRLGREQAIIIKNAKRDRKEAMSKGEHEQCTSKCGGNALYGDECYNNCIRPATRRVMGCLWGDLGLPF